MNRAPLVLLLLAAVAGCSQRPAASEVPPRAATPAARIEAIRAARLPSVSGHRDGPGGAATWRAFFADGELALLEEEIADPPRRPLHNEYYFEHGALAYFRGEQPATPGSGAVAPDARAPVVIEFQGRRATSAVRIEHYGPVPLEPERLAAIEQRAAELAGAAQAEHNAPRAGS